MPHTMTIPKPQLLQCSSPAMRLGCSSPSHPSYLIVAEEMGTHSLPHDNAIPHCLTDPFVFSPASQLTSTFREEIPTPTPHFPLHTPSMLCVLYVQCFLLIAVTGPCGRKEEQGIPSAGRTTPDRLQVR